MMERETQRRFNQQSTMKHLAPSLTCRSWAFLPALLLCLWMAVPLAAQNPPWTSTGPLCAGVWGVSFATADSKLAYTATVGRRSTLFVSRNDGATWKPTVRQPPVGSETIFGIAAHPDDENVIWVAANGVFKSEDGGRKWTNLSRGLPRPWVAWDLTVHPNDPAVLFVNSGLEIWKSDSGGGDWRKISPRGFFYRYAVHPRDPDVLWIGSMEGVRRSTNGGRRWKKTKGLPSGGGILGAPLAVDPTRRSTVYTALDGYVYRTTNGRRWKRLGRFGPEFGYKEAVFLDVDPERPSHLLLGLEEVSNGVPALWRSTDGGVSWTAEGLEGQDLLGVARHPGKPELVLIGAAEGLFRSQEGGSQPVRVQKGLYGGYVGELASVPPPATTTEKPVTYARTRCGLFSRRHRQSEWALVDTNFDAHDVTLGVSTGDPRMVYRGWRPFSSLFFSLDLSPDGGVSWQPLRLLGGGDRVLDLQASPADPLRVYASVIGRGLFVSTNGGESWGAAIDAGLTPAVLAPHPLRPETILVAGSRGVARSTDGGETWERLADFAVRDLAIDPASPSSIYALGESIYRSRDGGDSWSEIAGGLPGPGDHHSLVVDGGGALYLGMTEGVYRSTNGGRTWKPFDKGLPRGLETSVLPHRRLQLTSGGELLLATDEGVFVTRIP